MPVILRVTSNLPQEELLDTRITMKSDIAKFCHPGLREPSQTYSFGETQVRLNYGRSSLDSMAFIVF